MKPSSTEPKHLVVLNVNQVIFDQWVKDIDPTWLIFEDWNNAGSTLNQTILLVNALIHWVIGFNSYIYQRSVIAVKLLVTALIVGLGFAVD